ncbi:neuroendocrine convertase 2 isoform X4 [Agelaius tricolor]|uniref:neuroendocrine convertase 2 isoform X4 n=1 Tax=Agelaius tricolor TaxID=9191 RepID=UPI0039F1E4CA
MPPGPPLLRGSLLLLFLLHFFGPPARGAVYSNHFLVELHDGGQAEAERVAAEHGFGGVRKLPFLESGYFFYHNGLAKARRRRSLQHKLRLEKDSRVRKAVQQEGFIRRKRGYRDINDIDINMNDPLFTKQWYLINTGQADGTPGLDLNVAEAWELGYTGKGVTIGIMDDGIDYLHPDLASNYGRGGKGSIYVWASGDGGSYDDCNCDGYASSMWTISINSAINDGRTALYDESCSSTLASTFSNGRKRNPEAGVATTDLYGNCTLRHSGTSAAAPEAAGVFALALEANLHLTWRDMQHLTVLTSKRNQLHDEVHRWRRNGVGLEFNHLFGYGVLDAGAMVKMAKDWKTVPERFHCVGGSIQEPEKIPPSGKLFLTLTTDACEGKENFVRYLEHVQAVITVNSTRRGDLNINMTSPMGTKSILLSRRPRDDDSKVGFDKWPFMTTHTWGEDPRGTWALEIGFVGSQPQRGVLKEWTLMLHGTQSAPYIDQIVKDYQSKLAMSKKEELEEELDEAVERSLKSILSKK